MRTLSSGRAVHRWLMCGWGSGSPWGAGTFAGATGQRQPTPLELEIAQLQGGLFWDTVSKHKF